MTELLLIILAVFNVVNYLLSYYLAWGRGGGGCTGMMEDILMELLGSNFENLLHYCHTKL